MNYGSDRMQCPACGGIATCESIDVGVGLYLKDDFTCSSCGWEIYGPDDHGFISLDEIETIPVEAYDD